MKLKLIITVAISLTLCSCAYDPNLFIEPTGGQNVFVPTIAVPEIFPVPVWGGYNRGYNHGYYNHGYYNHGYNRGYYNHNTYNNFSHNNYNHNNYNREHNNRGHNNH